MSFDRIDRQFRNPAPVKLECSECSTTTADVKTRDDIDGNPVLCASCCYFKRMESWGGY